jgi:hypothetical protein
MIDAISGHGVLREVLELAPTGLQQPSGNSLVPIGKFLHIDSLLQGDRLIRADPLKDPLQAEASAGGKHDPLANMISLIASPDEPLVAEVTKALPVSAGPHPCRRKIQFVSF